MSPENSFQLTAPSQHDICEAKESSEETVQTHIISVVGVSADMAQAQLFTSLFIVFYLSRSDGGIWKVVYNSEIQKRERIFV